MPVQFSPAVLQTKHSLEKYLFAQKTIDAIKAKAKQPYTPPEPSGVGETTLALATYPFKLYGVLFLKATGYLLLLFEARETGLKLLAKAEYIEWDAIRPTFFSNLLVSTLNVASPDEAAEIYTHPAIPVQKVRNEDVLARFKFYAKRGVIEFDRLNGECAGSSNHFAHLFFRTRHVFRNEEQHLVAVAEQFRHGAGKEAALWQCAQYFHTDDHPPLLGLGVQRVHTFNNPTAEKVAMFFKKLKPGLYNLGPKSHSLNFYKGTKCDYVIEPNLGLLALRTPEQYAKWAFETERWKDLEVLRLSQNLANSSL